VFQLLISKADMNGTPFSAHAVHRFPTSSNTSSSPWQAEAVRGVQMAATLLIFLVMNPLFKCCALPLYIGLNIEKGAAD